MDVQQRFEFISRTLPIFRRSDRRPARPSTMHCMSERARSREQQPGTQPPAARSMHGQLGTGWGRCAARRPRRERAGCMSGGCCCIQPRQFRGCAWRRLVHAVHCRAACSAVSSSRCALDFCRLQRRKYLLARNVGTHTAQIAATSTTDPQSRDGEQRRVSAQLPQVAKLCGPRASLGRSSRVYLRDWVRIWSSSSLFRALP